MDRTIEEGAARYTAAQEEGQRFLGNRWSTLQTATTAALTHSGCYSTRGERLDGEFASLRQGQDCCERLEYALGVLKQCAAVRLPARTDKGAAIPREALDDEVLSSCEELLFVRAWHDPEFLRLGLVAVALHQQANALSMVGPPTTARWGCLGAVLKVGLLLLLPLAFAIGIAAAVKQDVGASVVAFYVVGAGVLAAMSALGIGEKKDRGFEQAHTAWTSFRLDRSVGVSGAGALEHLRQMAACGVKIPSIAFDLTDLLRSKMIRPEILDRADASV